MSMTTVRRWVWGGGGCNRGVVVAGLMGTGGGRGDVASTATPYGPVCVARALEEEEHRRLRAEAAQEEEAQQRLKAIAADNLRRKAAREARVAQEQARAEQECVPLPVTCHSLSLVTPWC